MKHGHELRLSWRTRIWLSEVSSQRRSHMLFFSCDYNIPHSAQLSRSHTGDNWDPCRAGRCTARHLQCHGSCPIWSSIRRPVHSTRRYEHSCCLDVCPTQLADHQAGVSPVLQVEVFHPWRDHQQPVGKPQQQNQECLLPVRIFGCLLRRLLLVAAWRDGTLLRHHPSHQHNIAEGCEFDEWWSAVQFPVDSVCVQPRSVTDCLAGWCWRVCGWHHCVVDQWSTVCDELIMHISLPVAKWMDILRMTRASLTASGLPDTHLMYWQQPQSGSVKSSLLPQVPYSAATRSTSKLWQASVGQSSPHYYIECRTQQPPEVQASYGSRCWSGESRIRGRYEGIPGSLSRIERATICLVHNPGPCSNTAGAARHPRKGKFRDSVVGTCMTCNGVTNMMNDYYAFTCRFCKVPLRRAHHSIFRTCPTTSSKPKHQCVPQTWHRQYNER